MKIPLGNSDYSRLDARNPRVIIRNYYYEEDPSNQIEGSTLIRRPGLKTVLELGDGPITALFYREGLFDGDFFAVSGDTLYRISRTGEESFSPTAIEGTLDTTEVPSMAATTNYLFITDGTALYYTDGTAPLTAISTPDDRTFFKLLYIGGYVLLLETASQRFYWIEPGENTIDPLNFAEAEGATDNVIDGLVLGDQIYLFGDSTIEIWYLSGDATAPLQRIQGKLFEIGGLFSTPVTISGEDNIFFVTTDGVAKLAPSMERVSSSGIEERILRAYREYSLSLL